MKLARLAPMIVAVAATSACAQSPSTAAVVDDVQISEAEVTAVIQGCQRAADVELARPNVVSNLVTAEIFRSVARDADIDINQGQVEQLLAESPETAPALADPDCVPFVEVNGLALLLQQDMARDDLLAAITNAPVDVNPRYGQWDMLNGQLIGDGSLSAIDETA
ncbi:MAG: hypothetical protein ACK5KO_01735 [Arachnia sp.]